MVNGGGVVTLEFRREPFATQQKLIRVPWNEIVLMDAVELKLDSFELDLTSNNNNNYDDEQARLSEAPNCSPHDYRFMRPQVHATPKLSNRLSTSNNNNKSAGQSRAVILKDSATVQQSIPLPGAALDANSSVTLTYISSRANEFMSTVSIQMIPAAFDEQQSKKLPQELEAVHLKVVVEGNLFEQVFEPEINLSFTYAWNRRNVYRQKSFGLSTALISVGYQYSGCRDIIWSRKQIQLAGHDLSISDIGNQWNLNIHHRYNYRDSILQRGDGKNFNLKSDKARLVVQPLIGDGYQRQAICSYCDGATTPSEQRLLRPQALVSGPDGALYVADYNLIRRVELTSAGQLQAERLVRTVLELPTSRVPSRYNLAMNQADQKLYLLDADRNQIFLVREQSASSLRSEATTTGSSSAANEMNTTQANEDSLIGVIGNGVRCQLGDPQASICGDGKPASLAQLVEPKAMAFDLKGRVYIADGPNVRRVDSDGKIYTILGNYEPALVRQSRFPSCSGEAVPMHKFIPRSPQDVAINPIDDTLYVLDDNVVYKVTQDKRVLVVAGRPSHCPSLADTSGRASRVSLQAASAIAFSQAGELFISEDDQKLQVSRVLVVTPDEDRIAVYAGGQQQHELAGSDYDSSLALQAADSQPRASNVLPTSSQLSQRAVDYKFSSVAAIAVDPQGKLIVADKLQLKIVAIEPDLPQLNAAGEYEIQSPDNSDELLVFNRHGHHMATREQRASSPANKFTFAYNVQTSFGQLISVQYATGNKISIYRNGAHHSVKVIETAFGGQCKLDVSRYGQVLSIASIAPNSTRTSFSYHVEGGLLKQSRDQASGEVFDFSYDDFGRATAIQHSSTRLTNPIECRLDRFASSSSLGGSGGGGGGACSALLVSE